MARVMVNMGILPSMTAVLRRTMARVMVNMGILPSMTAVIQRITNINLLATLTFMETIHFRNQTIQMAKDQTSKRKLNGTAFLDQTLVMAMAMVMAVLRILPSMT